MIDECSPKVLHMKVLFSRGWEERVDLEENADSMLHGRYYLELLAVG